MAAKKKAASGPVGNRAALLTNSELLMRTQWMQSLLNTSTRDLDYECGYPASITPQQYKEMYLREGVGQRVVSVYPEECWAFDPDIYETEDQTVDTEFERTLQSVNERHALFHYLQRIDELSGIGHYGVLLFGLDDGQDLDKPIPGINDNEDIDAPGDFSLTFIRCFDESLVQISEYVNDVFSPRHGQPLYYNITFADPRVANGGTGMGVDQTVRRVHWTRVLHVADNRISSEVFGVPRQECVWNRLLDLRKTLGGSAEMFWKGGFPGMSFETLPELGDVDLDLDALRSQFEDYSNSLQRYLALKGVSAKQLVPQVASPEHHIQAQLQSIAIAIKVPYRILVGSEEAKLSSTQDALTWHKRLARRQQKYLTPMLLRPCINRLIAYGVLPQAAYKIRWPDLNTTTDEDRATIAQKVATALATYVGGGVAQVFPPLEFFTTVLKLPVEQAEKITEAAEEQEVQLTVPGTEDTVSMGQSKSTNPNPNTSGQVPNRGNGKT